MAFDGNSVLESLLQHVLPGVLACQLAREVQFVPGGGGEVDLYLVSLFHRDIAGVIRELRLVYEALALEAEVNEYRV